MKIAVVKFVETYALYVTDEYCVFIKSRWVIGDSGYFSDSKVVNLRFCHIHCWAIVIKNCAKCIVGLLNYNRDLKDYADTGCQELLQAMRNFNIYSAL